MNKLPLLLLLVKLSQSNIFKDKLHGITRMNCVSVARNKYSFSDYNLISIHLTIQMIQSGNCGNCLFAIITELYIFIAHGDSLTVYCSLKTSLGTSSVSCNRHTCNS